MLFIYINLPYKTKFRKYFFPLHMTFNLHVSSTVCMKILLELMCFIARLSDVGLPSLSVAEIFHVFL